MKKYIRYIAALLLILAVVSAYSYLHVSGRELHFVSDISESYTATVTKTHASLDYGETEYILSSEQILQLKELIQNSSFTRILSSSFSYTGLKERYHIVLELTDQQGQQQEFITLYYVEDLFLRIGSAYDGIHLTLRINNPQWHAELEAILADS